MATVNQPTWLPTNKLTGALVVAAVWEMFGPQIVRLVGIALAPLGIPFGGPATVAILQIALAAIAGYLIKDRPNVTKPGD